MKTCCGRKFADDAAFDAHGTSVHYGAVPVVLRGETVEQAARYALWDIADAVKAHVIKLAKGETETASTLVPAVNAVDIDGRKSVITNPALDNDPAALPYKCPFCGRMFEEAVAEQLHEDLSHKDQLRAVEHPQGGEKQTKNSADASSRIEWVEVADVVGAASAGPADVDDCPIAACTFSGLPSAMVTHLGSPAHDQVDPALLDNYKRKKKATETAGDQADKPETFSDIQSAVQEAISALFFDPISERCPYIWIADISDAWVVFEVRSDYYKITYSMDDSGMVSLDGPPVSVQRRTIYVPVPSDDDDSDE